MCEYFQKTIGLDDDYIKKLEEQKKLREEILRKKAQARKKLTGDSNEKVGESEVSSTSRSSIYINPKAFRGDLSALNLPNLNVIKGSSIGGNNVKRSPPTNGNSAKKVVGTVPKTSATSSVTTSKPRTILKIIKDKHGNVISRSKVWWFIQSFLDFVEIVLFVIDVLHSNAFTIFAHFGAKMDLQAVKATV